MRRIRLVIAALLAAGLLFVGFALLPRLNDALIEPTGETDLSHQLGALLRQPFLPHPQTADLAPIAHAGLPPYGANTFFEQEVEEWKLRRSMEMLKEAGVRWVRQQMPWADIEPLAKGQYVDRFGKITWDKYDRMVALAEEYGLKILARLDAPPNWARQDNSVAQAPPDNLDDYGDFVTAFVSRYRGRIGYYQIWNEPNIYPEWGNRPVNAAQYLELLKVGYSRVKAADPQAVVVMAALAPTLGTPDGRNQDELSFLEELYTLGANDYFDILSVMGYGLWTGPGDRRAQPDKVNFSRPQLVREVMVRHGDASKPIWVAEVGWNALPQDFPIPATHGRVRLDLQARYAAQAYRRAQQEWPWMGVLFYWYFRPVSDENRDQVVYYFRMVDPEFTALPVYFAYQKMATAGPVVPYGYHQEDHYALSWEGPWQEEVDSRAALGAYRKGSAGAELSFVFRGNGLELVTRRGPAQGRLYVEIDGLGANQLPRDAQGRAYLDLAASEEAWQVRVPLVAGLSYGEHRVRLWVEAGPAVVDGLVVPGAEVDWRLAAVGVLLALGILGGLTILIARRRR